MQFAPAEDDPSLGGKLLYVGEPEAVGRVFTIAANIAGAATLAASKDPSALRQAQREGVIDFLVNSLDEALRILKNEIRKRQPVAVAVSLAPAAIETEMLERGVLADLLPPQSISVPRPTSITRFISQGAEGVREHQIAKKLMVWPAPVEFAQNLATFESTLCEYLAPGDYLNRRWLRLSPRYLGPAARRLRSIACDESTAASVIARLGPPLNHL
jgi:hypothetical protein